MADLIRVDLSTAQMELAAKEGRARRAAAETYGHQTLGPSTDPAGQDIVGVIGELAFAKWSRLPWTAGRRGAIEHQPDVERYEVRTRRLHSDRELFVKNKKQLTQPPSQRYVLVWASESSPIAYLVGWTTLGDIMEFGYTRRHDSTGLHSQYLRPMALLRKELHAVNS